MIALLVLNAQQVHDSLGFGEAIQAMKVAMASLSQRQGQIPERTHLHLHDPAGTMLIMPGHLRTEQTDALVVKMVGVFNENQKRGLANILGVTMVFDPQTGQPQALLDGAAITAIRTAATSAAATDLLARPESKVLSILGSGTQAASHISAITCIRDIQEIRIYAPRAPRVQQLVSRLQANPKLENRDLVWKICDSSVECTRGADIICTTTNSSVPVIDNVAVSPGTHINAIGSYQPTVAEIPAETVGRSRIFVDQKDAALKEAGDLIQAIDAGQLDASAIAGELGQVVLGTVTGRQSTEQVTLFKSVGNTIQDVVAAQLIVESAVQQNMGTRVTFSESHDGK